MKHIDAAFKEMEYFDNETPSSESNSAKLVSDAMEAMFGLKEKD